MNVEDLMQYMLNLFNNTDKELHEEYEKLSQKRYGIKWFRPLYRNT